MEYCNEVKKIAHCILVYGKHYFAFWKRKVQYKGIHFFTDLMNCDTDRDRSVGASVVSPRAG